MKKILDGEVFDEIFKGLETWVLYGVSNEKKDELLKFSREYFAQSSFGINFGDEIDVENEIENIKNFYSDYFEDSIENKINFFKKAYWSRKYKLLKEESFKIAKQTLEIDKVDGDIIYETKSLLARAEKTNRQLEKESEELQNYFFGDVKEIFLNCMYATTNDKTVLGKEIGEIFSWQEAVNKMKKHNA